MVALVDETLKKVASDNHIAATVDRADHRLALTPHIFRYGIFKDTIHSCLDKHIMPTDEAFAIESAGHKVLYVEGRRDNIKITRQEDLPIASAILKSQEAK